MIERKEISNEKTILIGTIKPGETAELIKEYLSELELLAETAGAEVVGTITQKISRINSATFIGKGKAKQIINQAEELNVNLYEDGLIIHTTLDMEIQSILEEAFNNGIKRNQEILIKDFKQSPKKLNRALAKTNFQRDSILSILALYQSLYYI